jgi:hypothetical protein
VACALYLATQHPQLLELPFVNDDYVFLDQTRGESLSALVSARHALFGWYRPWSREIYYGVMQAVFGSRELPFHLASVALWLGCLWLHFRLGAALIGVARAAVATLALATLTLWASPLLWAAGSQDLWMLLFALAYLWLVLRARTALALVPLLLALASKEPALLLPAIALGALVFVARRPLGAALRGLSPSLALALVWFAVHPTLLARMNGSFRDPETQAAVSSPAQFGHLLLAQINLDPLSRPDVGAGVLAGPVFLGVIVMLAASLLLWRSGRGRAPRAPDSNDQPRVRAFLLVWAVVGLIPAVLPFGGGHAYYGLLGTLGLSLLAMSFAPERSWMPLAVVAALAAVRPAVAATPSSDWGSPWYLQRAAYFLGSIRRALTAECPAPPAGSRFYFSRMPQRIGFLAGTGPALRVWYGRDELSGDFLSNYTPRAPESPGRDYFFRFDPTRTLVPIHTGAEDSSAVRDSTWKRDHEELASRFHDAGDHARAIEEYSRLALAEPAWPDYPFYLARSHVARGDSAGALPFIARAALLAGVPPDTIRVWLGVWSARKPREAAR